MMRYLFVGLEGNAPQRNLHQVPVKFGAPRKECRRTHYQDVSFEGYYAFAYVHWTGILTKTGSGLTVVIGVWVNLGVSVVLACMFAHSLE